MATILMALFMMALLLFQYAYMKMKNDFLEKKVLDILYQNLELRKERNELLERIYRLAIYNKQGRYKGSYNV
jgi:hypothetical protein